MAIRRATVYLGRQHFPATCRRSIPARPTTSGEFRRSGPVLRAQKARPPPHWTRQERGPSRSSPEYKSPLCPGLPLPYPLPPLRRPLPQQRPPYSPRTPNSHLTTKRQCPPGRRHCFYQHATARVHDVLGHTGPGQMVSQPHQSAEGLCRDQGGASGVGMDL